jgi:hypothetical protein
MRSRRVFAAVGTVIAIAVTFFLGNALGFCASESVPSTYVCPGGGGSCLLTCSFWSPAFLVGPLIGLLVALIAGFVVHEVTHRRA